MGTPVDTAPPAWANYHNWPEVLGAVDNGSAIGRLWAEAGAWGRQAREKKGEAGRLLSDADAFDAVVRDATSQTPWERVAKAATMGPIYRRDAARLLGEAEPMEAEAGRVMETVNRLWAEYLAALAKWQRKPTAEHAAALAGYVWPQ